MLRPLGSLEHIFWLLNRSVGNQVVLAAEIDGHTTPEDWRHALDALQRRHPMLAVRIPATSNGFPYFEPSEAERIPLRHAADAIWTADGIASEWLDREMALELNQPFDTASAPLMRVVLACDQRRSVAILICNHSICDGISLSFCFRDLLKALNGEPLDTMPFPPSIDQLCGAAEVPLPPSNISLEGIRYPRDVPTIHRLKLSPALTAQIAQRARIERTTVHGALCSALLRAGRSAIPEWRSRNVLFFSPVNLREQWNIDDDCGLFLGTGKVSLEPDRHESFWEVARNAMRGINVPGVRQSIGEQTRRQREALEGGLDAARAMELRQTALARDIMLTNLGRVRFDTTIGRFKLTAMWGTARALGLSRQPYGGRRDRKRQRASDAREPECTAAIAGKRAKPADRRLRSVTWRSSHSRPYPQAA